MIVRRSALELNWKLEAAVGTSKGIRRHRAKIQSAFAIALFALISPSSSAFAQTQDAGQPLQLSISAQSANVVEPFPARLILHFRNSGTQPLWLYRPVRDAATMSQSALGPSPGGSTLVAHLEPETHTTASASLTPGMGTLLRPAGMPRPKLFRISPGGTYDETLAIQLSPAKQETGSASQSLWGMYGISVAYSASYANGPNINRDLGVDLWQGSVSSNVVSIHLQAASGAASISGTVMNRRMEQDWGILVSLSDWNGHLVEQAVTGNDGGFSFSNLPYGRYWVTVRVPGSKMNTAFFEHADLSPSKPDANLRLIMLPPDEDDAKQLLHKPVLFRVRDNAGHPLANVQLDILWSNGPVMESPKVETNDDGLAEVNLLPGSNYVTIRRRDCPKQDEMVNVDSGPGIDGFPMVSDCSKQ
jgi:hypothetical protein